MPEPWLSMGGGTLMGMLYAAAGAFVLFRAVRASEQGQFVRLFLGGLALRFTLALLALVLVLTFAPVRPAVFAGAFVATAFAALLAEVAYAGRAWAGSLSK